MLFGVQNILIDDPYTGDLIPNTGGAWKIRYDLGNNQGKRGGCRVIYVINKSKNKIYFLLVYPKNRSTNLSKQQEKEVKHTVQDIMKENYVFGEDTSMSFYDDLMESLKQVKEYEAGTLQARELKPEKYNKKIKVKESSNCITFVAHVVKPNGQHRLVRTDSFTTKEELLEDYEVNGYTVLSIDII